jgi:hypothetical protein
MYRYLNETSVYSVTPNTGSMQGTTVATVAGKNFRNTPYLRCRVGGQENGSGGTITKAEFVTSEVVFCHIPVASATGGQPVWISVNGQDWNGSPTFYFFEQEDVLAIHPYRGPVLGGGTFTVTGNYFRNETDLSCRWDIDIVPGRFINSSAVACVSPYHVAGDVNISISSNGVDFSTSSADFLYLADMTVVDVYPPLGPDTGNTIVVVTGTNFVSGIRCRFGPSRWDTDSFGPSRWSPVSGTTLLNSTHLVCTTPTSIYSGSNFLGVDFVYLTYNYEDYAKGSGRYEYIPDWEVTKFWPTWGPVSGNTSVTIIGKNFLPGALTFCRIGMNKVTPIFLNTTALLCRSPAISVPDTESTVYVTLNDQHFWYSSSSPSKFHYVRNTTISWLSITRGPDHGGSSVYLMGANFLNTTDEFCLFNFTKVPAVFVNTSSVYCVSPPNNPAIVPVRYTNNDHDYTQMRKFRYDYNVTVTAIRPHISSVQGGVLISVWGTNFISNMTCRFDEDHWPYQIAAVSPFVTAATTVNSTYLKCFTPPSPNTRWRPFEVSTNLQDYTHSHFKIYFLEKPNITHIYPSTGFVKGGTLVKFQGFNFTNEFDFICMFGDTKIRADWVTEEECWCRSPVAAAAGMVQLSISVNNQEEILSSISYTYHSDIELTGINPTIGPFTGHTFLTVFGTNFQNITQYRCDFNDSMTEATYRSASSVVCYSPRSTIGVRNVNIRYYHDISSGNVTYRWAPIPVVHSVIPIRGVWTGYTTVTLTGENFQPNMRSKFETVLSYPLNL